eukprot:g14136.t1
MGVALKSTGIGGGAGMIGSLVGMGGGFVAIPFLTGWLGLTQHQAHGTSLAAVFATGAAGSTAYALAGHVDYQAAGAMAVAGVAAAHAGARCTAGVDGPTLKLALGVLMLVVAPMLPVRDKFLRDAGEPDETESSPDGSADRSSESEHMKLFTELHSVGQSRERDTKQEPIAAPPATSSSSSASHPGAQASTSAAAGAMSAEGAEPSLSGDMGSGKAAKMFAIGAGSGFLAGVFGVGGGILTVPSISLATDLGHKEVLGTSLAAMVLPALMGSATHFRQGNLIPRIALPLALGTGAGAFAGGKYAARHLDDATLKLVFSCLMFVLGVKTVAGARAAAAAATKTASKVAKKMA